MGKQIELKDAKVSKLAFDAAVNFSADEGELTGFNIDAYTGAILNRWWGKLAIDVSGIQAKEQMPIFRDHNPSQIVGYSNKISNADTFKVGGVFSKQTEAAKEVMGLAAEGFPWQASIGVKPKTIVEIREGAAMAVNGQEVSGPAEVWLESEVIETSFVPLGADGNTSVTVFSEVEKEVANPAATNKTMRDTMDLEKLKADHPDLVEAIAAEATAGHDEALAQARSEGGKEMLTNIKAKLALSIPGHEKLAEEMAYNSEISEAQASKRMLDAVREEKESFAQDFKNDAPPPAPQPGEGEQLNDRGPMTEEEAKAKWDKDVSLRAEFADEFDVYLAYISEQKGVKVKALKDREGK